MQGAPAPNRGVSYLLSKVPGLRAPPGKLLAVDKGREEEREGGEGGRQGETGELSCSENGSVFTPRHQGPGTARSY